MKTLDRLKADPRVSDVSDERQFGDGYFICLKPEFADVKFDPWQPTRTIHEYTVRDLLRRMRDVRPCAVPQDTQFANPNNL
jgi:hypothetical protein